MKRYYYFFLIASLLIAASAVVYVIQCEVFHDLRDTIFYLLQDLAFLPIQVLLVALLVENLLSRREKNRLLHKMNMVIGTFFSEVGVTLLGQLTKPLQNRSALSEAMAIRDDWTPPQWASAIATARDFDYRFDTSRIDLTGLRTLLSSNRQFLAMLLANPNLLEHEQFTDLLWAVSHLGEELSARPSLTSLPATDLEHLAGDARRVVSQLTQQWLRYCQHLQSSYPYIFSIMVRTHPLQEAPSAVVLTAPAQ